MQKFRCELDAGRNKDLFGPCNGLAIPKNPFTLSWECWYCGGAASSPSWRHGLRLRRLSMKNLMFKIFKIDPHPALTKIFKDGGKAILKNGKWVEED